MNKKNMAMLIAIAMIFSLFTGINFGTGKAQAEVTNPEEIIAATNCAINVSGESGSVAGEEAAGSWSREYKEYSGTAELETEAVSKAAFTISATTTAVASYYYIEEVADSDNYNYTVKNLDALESLESAHWNKYENQKITLSDYAGKRIVIYAKFESPYGNVAYLHTKIIKIAEATPMETPTAPTTEPSQSPTGAPTTEPSQSPTGEPTAEPSQSPTGKPTAEPSQSPTGEPTTEPSQNPTGTPTAEPSQNPTGTPTVEPSQNPTGTPTAEPSQSPTENPTTEPSQTPMVTPTVEPSKTPDKKLSVNYDNSDKYVKSGTALNLKVTVKTDAQCTYKWYKKGSDKSLSEKSSYKTRKNAKIGKYTYYCEISADGYETVKCDFTVMVYKPNVTVAWGSSASSKEIFGTSLKVKKITVPSKYKKNLSVNAKTGKVSVKKYFSGKAVVTYVIGKNKIKITVKSKIPQIKYTATYSKKKQQLEIKINRFVMSNLSHVYIMAKGNNHWNSRCYKLVKLPIKKKKNSVIIKGYTVKITNFEMKFLLNTNADTYKAWKHNKKSKTNVVKQK